MNSDTYHILNGDVLAERLPKEIEGHRIVFREAFINGPITPKGHELDFWLNRQAHFKAKYNWNDLQYFKMVTKELFKIRQIKVYARVNIWIETDLFCYSNLWFICNLLKDKFPGLDVRFVIPEKSSVFGFESMIDEELIYSYKSRQSIDKDIITKLSNCWQAYCQDDHKKLSVYGKELKAYLVNIDKIIDAHLSRIESNESDTKPLKTLKLLVKQIGTENYETLFWEFSKIEKYYGYNSFEFNELYKAAIK